MLTLLAVFRDIIPAYRIRPMQEEEEGADKASNEAATLQHAGCCSQRCSAPSWQLAVRSSRQRSWMAAPKCNNACQLPCCWCVMQLSKEVRALRTHEAALLAGYHTYLKALLQV
jgi:hypothetical protein